MKGNDHDEYCQSDHYTDYEVTLRLRSHDDEEGDPKDWDWTSLTDSKVPVVVVKTLALKKYEEFREPTDDEIYNGPGREGGIAYGPDDSPGSLGEHDYRL